MSNTMRAFLLSGLILTAPALADQGQSNDGIADPFHGEWTLQVTPDQATACDGQAEFSESVLFHNGEFSAAAFAMFGFTPTTYALSADTGATVFSSTLTSSDRGTLTFTGHAGATGIVGDLVWARPDGVTYRYEIVGERPSPD